MNKGYNARAQPLFSSINFLFSDVPVAVAVVVFLNSLIFVLLKVENSLTNSKENKKPQTSRDLQLLNLPVIGCSLSTWNFLPRVFQQPAN